MGQIINDKWKSSYSGAQQDDCFGKILNNYFAVAANVSQQLQEKQETLISGQNIATINGQSLLNGGNINPVKSFAQLNIPYQATISLVVNQISLIAQLSGNITLILGQGQQGYSNEWQFTLTQGATAYTVVLPTGINWGLGAAPTFDANTTTYVILYYIGETLCGEWRTV